jgi:hypothetical protein
MGESTSAVTRPTVSRWVHYYPPDFTGLSELGEPLAALVIRVLDDGRPVLEVHSERGIQLVYDAQYSSGPVLGCWTWPPRV